MLRILTAIAVPVLLSLQAPLAAAVENDSPACTGPAKATRLDQPLTRTGQKLAAGQPITIVAVGSSSTAGAGATSPTNTYPAKLEAELKARFPRSAITVLNRGANGQETADILGRLDTTVLNENPDLILWQVGTNSVLRDHSTDAVAANMHDGIARMKASGADVVLIGPQYAPKVLVKGETRHMLEVIAQSAKAENVNLFRRFAVMQYWLEDQGLPFVAFLSPDGLHMNDWGYGCWAKLLSASITEAATRATAVAGTASPRM